MYASAIVYDFFSKFLIVEHTQINLILSSFYVDTESIYAIV